MLALALLLALGHDDPADAPFLKLGVSPLLFQSSVEIRVSLRPARKQGEDLSDDRILFAGDFKTRDKVEHRWTDGGHCPGALAVLRKVEQLAMPSPRVPQVRGSVTDGYIVMDGTAYDLEVRSSSLQGQETGPIHISSNVRTDLANWADALLAALKPCWSPRRDA